MKGLKEKDPAASRAVPQKFKGNNSACHRCNKEGHWHLECPLKDTIYWFCNNCKHVTDHKSNECTANRQPRGMNKRFSNQYDESHGPPAKKMSGQPQGMANGRGKRTRGRGGQTGGGRGNGRGNPRGRESRRGSKNQSSARRAEYEDNQLQPNDQDEYAEEEYDDEYAYDESQGNKVPNNTTNKKSRIEFICQI